MRGWSTRFGCLAVAVLLTGGACFSDRDPITAQEALDCRVLLADGEVTGAELPPALRAAVARGEARVVAMRDFAFQPTDITLPVGGTVVWLNCEEDAVTAHTSTSDGGVWASELLQPGRAYTETFTTPGRFTYHCEPHPFMTGAVVVEGDPQPLP